MDIRTDIKLLCIIDYLGLIPDISSVRVDVGLKVDDIDNVENNQGNHKVLVNF